MIPDGTTIDLALGSTAQVWAQSLDEYGNELDTDVIFTPSDPALIEDEYDGGLTEYTFATPEAAGTFTIRATEDDVAATLTIEAAVPPGLAVFRSYWYNNREVYVGSPHYAGWQVGSAPGDVEVYDGNSGWSLFPTFTQDADKVAFAWDDGPDGFWNVGLVDADGDDAAAPAAILPDDYESTIPWGFPVFIEQTDTEGKMVFLSDRDPDKIADGDQMWDLYIWDPDAGDAEKITDTDPADDFLRWRGLSLSADEDKVLAVQRYVADDGTGNPVYSQVVEIDLSDGTIDALTSNTSADVNYLYATYSPDNSVIYIDAEVSSYNQVNLYEFDGTSFQLIRDDNTSYEFIPEWGNTGRMFMPTFDPDDSNTMLINDDIYLRFVDVADPQNNAADSRIWAGHVSWSRR
jgi:hypothetical protein